MDVAGHKPEETLARLAADEAVSENTAQFARALVDGVLANRSQIDEIIQRTAPLWPKEQLSPVDRNILRLAIREFLVDNLTPVSAAINEAIELAKKFGSESSGKFVNGVLGSVSGLVQAPPPEQEGT